MKYPFQEKGAHASAGEFSQSQEYNPQRELQREAEFGRTQELFKSEEHAEPNPSPARKDKQEENRRNAALLSQYAAGFAAVAVAAAVGIGAAAIPALPPTIFTVPTKSVGLDFIECALRIEQANGGAFTARLLAPSGEALAEVPLSEAEQALRFSHLAPETEYSLCVVDENGETKFTYSFETEPFVRFLAEEGNKIGFTLHDSISFMLDVHLDLVDAQGKSFSSNVMLDPLATSYLYYDGLYRNDYVLSLTSYPMEENEEPTVYEKKLALGSLTPLSFTPTIDYAGGELILEHTGGELVPYTAFEVSFEQENAYYSVREEEVRLDGNDLFIPLPAAMPQGSYSFTLNGSFQTADNYFWNEIWKTDITY